MLHWSIWMWVSTWQTMHWISVPWPAHAIFWTRIHLASSGMPWPLSLCLSDQIRLKSVSLTWTKVVAAIFSAKILKQLPKLRNNHLHASKNKCIIAGVLGSKTEEQKRDLMRKAREDGEWIKAIRIAHSSGLPASEVDELLASAVNAIAPHAIPIKQGGFKGMPSAMESESAESLSLQWCLSINNGSTVAELVLMHLSKPNLWLLRWNKTSQTLTPIIILELFKSFDFLDWLSQLAHNLIFSIHPLILMTVYTQCSYVCSSLPTIEIICSDTSLGLRSIYKYLNKWQAVSVSVDLCYSSLHSSVPTSQSRQIVSKIYRLWLSTFKKCFYASVLQADLIDYVV